MDSRLDDFRKQHSILGHLIAQEIGRQTHHGLAGKSPKGEDFSWKDLGYIFPRSV